MTIDARKKFRLGAWPGYVELKILPEVPDTTKLYTEVFSCLAVELPTN